MKGKEENTSIVATPGTERELEREEGKEGTPEGEREGEGKEEGEGRGSGEKVYNPPSDFKSAK